MKTFSNIGKDKSPPTAKDLVDLPLADPLKLYVYPGERPKLKRGPRAQYTDEIGEKLSRRQVDEMKIDAKSKKVNALWDYYATTQVPFERVAEHTGYSLDIIIAAMKDRGRLS